MTFQERSLAFSLTAVCLICWCQERAQARGPHHPHRSAENTTQPKERPLFRRVQ